MQGMLAGTKAELAPRSSGGLTRFERRPPPLALQEGEKNKREKRKSEYKNRKTKQDKTKTR